MFFQKSNIFLFYNKQKNEISIKIGDLGQSKEINEEFLKTLVGKRFHFSPEMVAKQQSSLFIKYSLRSEMCPFVFCQTRFILPFSIFK